MLDKSLFICYSNAHFKFSISEHFSSVNWLFELIPKKHDIL